MTGDETAGPGTDGVIRVLRGNPTPEELAAALTVVRARLAAAAAQPEPPRVTAEWGTPGGTARRTVPAPGPDAWHTTYWPR